MGKIERGMLNGSGYEVWMRRRETEFCDEVEPVHVEIVNGENVVWSRRKGVSEIGYFDFHHIGCDHLGGVPRGESEIQAMLGCKAVQLVLCSSADSTAHEIFATSDILPTLIHSEGNEVYLDEDGEELASLFVFEALALTIQDPERCQGNIRTGMHVKPILQRMLGGIEGDQLDEIVNGLQYQGLVEYKDPIVTLAA